MHRFSKLTFDISKSNFIDWVEREECTSSVVISYKFSSFNHAAFDQLYLGLYLDRINCWIRIGNFYVGSENKKKWCWFTEATKMCCDISWWSNSKKIQKKGTSVNIIVYPKGGCFLFFVCITCTSLSIKFFCNVDIKWNLAHIYRAVQQYFNSAKFGCRIQSIKITNE